MLRKDMPIVTITPAENDKMRIRIDAVVSPEIAAKLTELLRGYVLRHTEPPKNTVH